MRLRPFNNGILSEGTEEEEREEERGREREEVREGREGREEREEREEEGGSCPFFKGISKITSVPLPI